MEGCWLGQRWVKRGRRGFIRKVKKQKTNPTEHREGVGPQRMPCWMRLLLAALAFSRSRAAGQGQRSKQRRSRRVSSAAAGAL